MGPRKEGPQLSLLELGRGLLERKLVLINLASPTFPPACPPPCPSFLTLQK